MKVDAGQVWLGFIRHAIMSNHTIQTRSKTAQTDIEVWVDDAKPSTILKTFPFGTVCLLLNTAPLETLTEPVETRIYLLDSIERRLRPRAARSSSSSCSRDTELSSPART